jgi:hypothetical protein
MGYWSEHPMAGDTPMDVRDNLDFLLIQHAPLDYYVTDNEDDYAFNTEKFSRKAKRNSIKKALKRVTLQDLLTAVEELPCVLPFFLLDWNLFPYASKLYKGDLVETLLKSDDGGGDERGYDDEDSESPQATMSKFYKLMKQAQQLKIPYHGVTDALDCPRLFGTIMTKSGLVNTN